MTTSPLPSSTGPTRSTTSAPLLTLLRRHRRGAPVGVTAVCSAHPLVLRAAAEQAAQDGAVLLVEATSNQVDQFGGYTGMLPGQFRDLVLEIATAAGLDPGAVVLGGDHLGPQVWRREGAQVAMARAEDLVRAYVGAGFTKIHLDCSMPCAGDEEPLTDEVVARRAARLARVAEDTAAAIDATDGPVYVIGTEVPVPGGAHEQIDSLTPTSLEAARATLAAHRDAFEAAGVGAAWSRVVGLVVQPGVEFDAHDVFDYVPERTESLRRVVDDGEAPPALVLEAHSTDYQTERNLHALVRDHFAILKVGPAATNALREASFALAAIEDALVRIEDRSQLVEVLERCMLEQPRHWQKHYSGSPDQLRMLRKFALSDRSRYYWGEPALVRALARLHDNLGGRDLPLPLISQYLPEQLEAVQEDRLAARAADLARHKVGLVLARYVRACHANAAERV